MPCWHGQRAFIARQSIGSGAWSLLAMEAAFMVRNPIEKAEAMRLIETRNFRTGAKQQFIDGRRVSNHAFSRTWLELLDSDETFSRQGNIEQARYGDRVIWKGASA